MSIKTEDFVGDTIRFGSQEYEVVLVDEFADLNCEALGRTDAAAGDKRIYLLAEYANPRALVLRLGHEGARIGQEEYSFVAELTEKDCDRIGHIITDVVFAFLDHMLEDDR